MQAPAPRGSATRYLRPLDRADLPGRLLVLVEELFRRQGPEVGQRGVQLIVRPVPPGQCLHALGDGLLEAPLDDARRISHHDRVWRDILGYDRAGCDDGAGTDIAPGQDDGAMPDPGVVADSDPQREYEESWNKAKALAEAVDYAEQTQ